MTEQMANIVYLIAGVLFIFSLAGLAKQETARSGNLQPAPRSHVWATEPPCRLWPPGRASMPVTG